MFVEEIFSGPPDEGDDDYLFPRRLRYTEEVLPLHYSDPSASGNVRPLQVHVRVKPAAPQASGCCLTMMHNQALALLPPSSTGQQAAASKRATGSVEVYSSSKVHQGAVQQQYYEEVVQPLVRDLTAMRCGNNVVMAYGASGTGKSFTMQGTPTHPGMVHRALAGVFDEGAAEGTQQVSVSFFEVYDNKVFDLLKRGHEPLHIQALGHACCVPGLIKCHCTSAEQAQQLYQAALRARKQAATGINAVSSRSHAVFTIQLLDKATGCSCRLSLVDLAGAERAHRTKNDGVRLKESSSINSSLMVLGRCIDALRAQQQQQQGPAGGNGGGGGRQAGAPMRTMVPVRESALTRLFQDVLQGQGQLVLSAHVSPDPVELESNRHTLKFVALASTIVMAPQPAEQAPAQPQPQPLVAKVDAVVAAAAAAAAPLIADMPSSSAAARDSIADTHPGHDQQDGSDKRGGEEEEGPGHAGAEAGCSGDTGDGAQGGVHSLSMPQGQEGRALVAVAVAGPSMPSEREQALEAEVAALREQLTYVTHQLACVEVEVRSTVTAEAEGLMAASREEAEEAAGQLAAVRAQVRRLERQLAMERQTVKALRQQLAGRAPAAAAAVAAAHAHAEPAAAPSQEVDDGGVENGEDEEEEEERGGGDDADGDKTAGRGPLLDSSNVRKPSQWQQQRTAAKARTQHRQQRQGSGGTRKRVAPGSVGTCAGGTAASDRQHETPVAGRTRHKKVRVA